MSIAEALWVTERDYSRYHAPGSSVSRAIVAVLTKQDAAILERRFEGFILYRQGLDGSSDSNEVLLVSGFDPAGIPSDRKTPAMEASHEK